MLFTKNGETSGYSSGDKLNNTNAYAKATEKQGRCRNSLPTNSVCQFEGNEKKQSIVILWFFHAPTKIQKPTLDSSPKTRRSQKPFETFFVP